MRRLGPARAVALVRRPAAPLALRADRVPRGGVGGDDLRPESGLGLRDPQERHPARLVRYTKKSGLGAGPGHPEPRRERTRNSASQERSCRLILKQR
jgi:hypothetical protein